MFCIGILYLTKTVLLCAICAVVVNSTSCANGIINTPSNCIVLGGVCGVCLCVITIVVVCSVCSAIALLSSLYVLGKQLNFVEN